MRAAADPEGAGDSGGAAVGDVGAADPAGLIGRALLLGEGSDMMSARVGVGAGGGHGHDTRFVGEDREIDVIWAKVGVAAEDDDATSSIVRQ